MRIIKSESEGARSQKMFRDQKPFTIFPLLSQIKANCNWGKERAKENDSANEAEPERLLETR